ncbi:MAG: hypothetical protein JSW67_03290 [Candidatus Latescibacterota bacterium]|nr:MAG: hypothetical protein JSW67_03290 [Candidatus Latescibacterota bacterium]
MHTSPIMPAHKRLPKNVYRRGKAYYYRSQAGGQDRRVSLGTDYNQAMQQYARIAWNGGPMPRMTVQAAADRWLETRIATGRNERGQQIVRARVAMVFSTLARTRVESHA